MIAWCWSARVIAPLQQRLGALQVVVVLDAQLQVAGAEMADVADVAAEAWFQLDRAGVDLDVTSSSPLYGRTPTQATFLTRR